MAFSTTAVRLAVPFKPYNVLSKLPVSSNGPITLQDLINTNSCLSVNLIANSEWSKKIPLDDGGLMRDDCLYETPDVKEALRRIPEHVVDERNFRIVRAMQLSLTKSILPKGKWTKRENDVLYLTPTVDAVTKERKEREAWEAEN